MKEISQSQVKIIAAFFILVAAFFVFWLFVYAPGRDSMEDMKSELAVVQAQIVDIESKLDKDVPIGESVRLLKEKFSRLDSRFPEKEEETIRALSELAQKRNIEVVSIQPRAKVIFIDSDDKEVELGGEICQVVYTAMDIKCSYKDLVDYITILKRELPAFVTIERLAIHKDRGKKRMAASDLNIQLELNFYLLAS